MDMTHASPDDLPPHLTEQPMQAAVPRPIEASTIHFRAHGRCYAAIVVDVIADDPLSPDFRIDAVVFAPRDRSRTKDRFTQGGALPGSVRWANNLAHAEPVNREDPWPETTWHYPGRRCLPEVVLDGAQS